MNMKHLGYVQIQSFYCLVKNLRLKNYSEKLILFRPSVCDTLTLVCEEKID